MGKIIEVSLFLRGDLPTEQISRIVQLRRLIPAHRDLLQSGQANYLLIIDLQTCVYFLVSPVMDRYIRHAQLLICLTIQILYLL